MNYDNLTSKDLTKIVQLYGGDNVTVCKHCNTIQEVPEWEKWMIYYLDKEYPSACDGCQRRFPSCCVEKSIYPIEHYKEHPKHVLTKNGYEIYLCFSCIKRRRNGKILKFEKVKKKDLEVYEPECTNCSVPESDCGNVLSRCKTCRDKMCDMCILNDLCVCCHDNLGFDTKNLQIGDRVIYNDCGPILTEATVKKIGKIKSGSQKIRILCDRGYEWNDPPKAIDVYRKNLRKM